MGLRLQGLGFRVSGVGIGHGRGHGLVEVKALVTELWRSEKWISSTGKELTIRQLRYVALEITMSNALPSLCQSCRSKLHVSLHVWPCLLCTNFVPQIHR